MADNIVGIDLGTTNSEVAALVDGKIDVLAADPDFVKEVAHPRLVVEALPPHQPAGIEARMRALMPPRPMNRARKLMTRGRMRASVRST